MTEDTFTHDKLDELAACVDAGDVLTSKDCRTLIAMARRLNALARTAPVASLQQAPRYTIDPQVAAAIASMVRADGWRFDARQPEGFLMGPAHPLPQRLDQIITHVLTKRVGEQLRAWEAK